MKLQLDFPIDNSGFNLTHESSFLLMGSCFASSMQPHFHTRGLHCVSNPFGVIFHPIALVNLLTSILETKDSKPFQREEVWLSWESASSVFGFSENEFSASWNQARNKLYEQLKSATVLVFTFGTSWGYRLKSSGEIVANCHKMPSNYFEKTLYSVGEMESIWSELLVKIRKINPEVKVVFTVSPVRHIKDGLVENNRSKSHLISLAHQLSEKFDNSTYFPSYELVVDVLRDYRFFKEDLVHPNEIAVKYVFEAFQSCFFSEESIRFGEKIRRVNNGLNHRSIHQNSNADLKRIEQLKKIKRELQVKYPFVYWG